MWSSLGPSGVQYCCDGFCGRSSPDLGVELALLIDRVTRHPENDKANHCITTIETTPIAIPMPIPPPGLSIVLLRVGKEVVEADEVHAGVTEDEDVVDPFLTTVATLSGTRLS